MKRFRQSQLWEDWISRGAWWIESSTPAYGASLSCTDAGDVDPETLTTPADAVVFRLRGVGDDAWAMLSSNSFDADTIGAVKSLSDEIARLGDVAGVDADTVFHSLLITEGGTSVQISADSLGKALTEPLERTDPTLIGESLLAKRASDRSVRLAEAARRQIMGLLLALPIKSNWIYEGAHASNAARLRGLPKGTKLAVLGAPVRCDVTEGVRRYLGGEGKSPTVRFMVRGHYRNQAHGPDRSLRKVLWIQPHWKGDDDAPVLVRPRVIGGSKQGPSQGKLAEQK